MGVCVRGRVFVKEGFEFFQREVNEFLCLQLWMKIVINRERNE